MKLQTAAERGGCMLWPEQLQLPQLGNQLADKEINTQRQTGTESVSRVES